MTKAQTAPHLDYEKYSLKNGLEVILSEDRRLPLVAVNLWYHVGPANERQDRRGFAHLFEHMMFQGSKYAGDEAHFRYLEAAGASDINGTTDFDRTNYFETLPSNQLELALWLESDRMGFLLEKLDHEKLENQRDVVRNERRQSVESIPYGLVEEELFHQLFAKEHPYHASVIGSHADIEAAGLEDVREFFKLYYAPNNACLAIVGDIDKAETKALVEKYFGPIPSGPAIPKVEVYTPMITSERRIVVTDQVELPRLYFGWITDPIYQPGDAECDLIAKILGGGKSSRLYKSLVYEKRIAQDVIAQQYSLFLGSIFYIQATAKPGVQLHELEEVLDEELEAFRRDGPKESELDRARNIFESGIIRGLETLGGFGGVADRLNNYNHFLSDPGYLARDLERYQEATVESLQAVARTRHGKQARIVIHAVSGNKVVDDVPRSDQNEAGGFTAKDEPSIPNQDWRRKLPKPGCQSPLLLPVPKTFELSNGLTVLFVEEHALPIVSANLVILSGSAANPKDRPGLASFTAGMLDEGTEARSALQIADDADQLGASLSTGSSTDISYMAVRSLKRNADAALELISDMLMGAVFPADEIQRVRHDRLTHLLQQRDNPSTLATKAFFRTLYGPNHPYGHTEIGTQESLQAITREELVEFWKSGYTPGNAALIVAGDLSEQELLELTERHFGKWSGKPKFLGPPEPPAPTSRRVVIIDKPGSPQTSLLIGHVGVTRANPDYEAIDVMNTQLGGLFSSRINLNLREKNGYTYGASSSFSSRRGAGPFLVGAGVRTDVTASAVTEIIKEIDLIRSTETTADELQMAKDSITRSLPGLFETTPQTASSIGGLFIHQLELDYYRQLPDNVGKVTVAEIQRVAKKYLKPEELVVVAVGDRKEIEPQLAALQFGQVEVRDVDDKPINSE